MMSKIPVEKRKKVMVFGTFDGLHRGHLNFFKQARQLARNSYLIVSVARDQNVLKIKGKYPKRKERARALLIHRSKLAHKVVLSGLKNHIPHIQREKPDIIALGYDQKAYVAHLKKDLRAHGLTVKIVRLKPFKEHIYKNHLLQK